MECGEGQIMEDAGGRRTMEGDEDGGQWRRMEQPAVLSVG